MLTLIPGVYFSYVQLRLEPVVTYGQLGAALLAVFGFIVSVIILKRDVKAMRETVVKQGAKIDELEKDVAYIKGRLNGRHK